MDILLKRATIIAPGDKNHLQTKDILVSKGKIEKIANNISAPKVKVIESDNLHVSIGWMDIGTHIGEPGLEHRETIDSAARAAAAGGYTDIAIMPIVYPVTHSKSEVSYIVNNQPNNGVRIHSIGAVSKDAKGEDLTEMIDMSRAGAIAFGDGLKSIKDSGMMMRALQYAKAVNKPIINYSIDKSLVHDGQMHEGDVSVSLGMQGIPSLAEHVAIQRDISLAEYTESELVLHCVSTEEGCDLIKKAIKDDINISATVSYVNLIHIDQDLKSFNSNLKVKPPIRSNRDRKALINSVRKGSIQTIVSNHVPLEEEQKKLEFSYAGFGATGLETCFAAVNTHLSEDIPLEQIISALTLGPRIQMKTYLPAIKSGEVACLTVFDPSISWTYESKTKKSISANNKYLSTSLTGKVLATIIGSKVNM
ncbi:MAG: dihydroorotase [Saprospiraceae bacterium]